MTSVKRTATDAARELNASDPTPQEFRAMKAAERAVEREAATDEHTFTQPFPVEQLQPWEWRTSRKGARR